LQRYLKGLRVRTTHFLGQREENEQTWTINGLPFIHEKPTAAKAKFTIPANAHGHEEHRSVLDHFEIECPALYLHPGDLVVTCGREEKFFPARYLQVLPGQLYKNKVDMVEEAVHTPDLNSTMITTAGRQIFGLSDVYDRDSPISKFDIGTDANMVSVTARLLPQPPVVFRGFKTQITPKEADNGKWNLGQRTLRKPVQGHKWACLEIFLPKNQAGSKKGKFPKDTPDTFCTKFEGALHQYGIVDCPCIPIEQNISGFSKYEDTLGNEELLERQLLGTFDDLKKSGIKLVIVFLPYKATGLYQIVKKVGDTKIGIHTICHVCADGPNTDVSVLVNLVLKFNIKLGSKLLSANQVLASRAPILTDNTMIFGIDGVSWPSHRI
jgi:eukaryotic translation initiation factor 2C